jgi:uncharacterized membrane protein YidH (DUF202 family)
VTSDPGSSNERTALAWQRTALALIGGSAVMARLTAPDLGWWAVGLLSAALLLSLWVFVESRARYARRTVMGPSPRGGRAAASLTAATLLLAVTELTALLAVG